MKKLNLPWAATETWKLACKADKSLPTVAPHRDAYQDQKGMGVHHAIWMLNRIRIKAVVSHKAHRWLGYAQAILVYEGLCTLDDLKKISVRGMEEEDPRCRKCGHPESLHIMSEPHEITGLQIPMCPTKTSEN